MLSYFQHPSFKFLYLEIWTYFKTTVIYPDRDFSNKLGIRYWCETDDKLQNMIDCDTAILFVAGQFQLVITEEDKRLFLYWYYHFDHRQIAIELFALQEKKEQSYSTLNDLIMKLNNNRSSSRQLPLVFSSKQSRAEGTIQYPPLQAPNMNIKLAAHLRKRKPAK